MQADSPKSGGETETRADRITRLAECIEDLILRNRMKLNSFGMPRPVPPVTMADLARETGASRSELEAAGTLYYRQCQNPFEREIASLSLRSRRVLINCFKVASIDDLSRLSRAELEKARGLGPSSIAEIVDICNRLGVKLRS